MLLPTYARAWGIKPRRPLLFDTASRNVAKPVLLQRGRPKPLREIWRLLPLPCTKAITPRGPMGQTSAVKAHGGEFEGHGLCSEAGAKQGEGHP